MNNKVTAIIILEILGKPADYVKETLIKIVEEIRKIKDAKIITSSVAEPMPVEKQDNVFTTFAEIEIEIPLQELMLLIFRYTPSHIEIVTPENLQISSFDLNSFFNQLVVKLHQYDEVARTMMIERQIIAQHVKEGKVKIEKEKPAKKTRKKRK